ncbi:nuclear transport factor 2 family protein [Frateuria hangzhouensis]|uniref:nuclear transport factor 2 family protein n=1 Tax=Frateuria hangzhouensis TaxID=2995589 RepID=UPI00226101FB|nr:nuclear transport factor 2 family protein [Frateuria sp. STR12]MCX7513192.1 nuclear transport factor 2 family protein [Frateuria sp. STR12]
MKIATAVFALAVAFHAHDVHATSPHAMLPPALATAVAAFDRAQVDGDGAALQRLLADDYVLFNSRARVEDKADFIRDYTAAGYSLKPFTVEEEVVRHWPGGAVLGGVATLEGTSEGKPFKVRLRFADIWREQDGRWQVIFTEATRVPSP